MPFAWSDRWIRSDDGTLVRNRGGAVVVEDSAYDDMTKDELSEELERRGLAKSGNKDELIARLQEDDEGEE